MFSDINSKKQFTTLIACADVPVLQTSELDIDELVLIYTHTQNEAASTISGQLFNLILIDLALNAPSLLFLAKSFDCINYDTPIIAMAENLDQNQKQMLLTEGFDDCVLKPLNTDHLEELIKFWRENDNLTPYIDSIEILLSKTKNNIRLVNVLYEKLFEELPIQIITIENAIKIGDYKTAFEATHHLNGSAKTCYLIEIADIANSLEMSLVQNNFEYADGFFWMLKQNVSSFIKHRKSILEFLNDRS
jgi:HPt (histidine-containing phosphotransfer) domain-containing protein